MYMKNRTQYATTKVSCPMYTEIRIHWVLLCSTASNIYREILQEVQQYCPIDAVYAEILQEMQQIQR